MREDTLYFGRLSGRHPSVVFIPKKLLVNLPPAEETYDTKTHVWFGLASDPNSESVYDFLESLGIPRLTRRCRFKYIDGEVTPLEPHSYKITQTRKKGGLSG